MAIRVSSKQQALLTKEDSCKEFKVPGSQDEALNLKYFIDNNKFIFLFWDVNVSLPILKIPR